MPCGQEKDSKESMSRETVTVLPSKIRASARVEILVSKRKTVPGSLFNRRLEGNEHWIISQAAPSKADVIVFRRRPRLDPRVFIHWNCPPV